MTHLYVKPCLLVVSDLWEVLLVLEYSLSSYFFLRYFRQGHMLGRMWWWCRMMHNILKDVTTQSLFVQPWWNSIMTMWYILALTNWLLWWGTGIHTGQGCSSHKIHNSKVSRKITDGENGSVDCGLVILSVSVRWSMGCPYFPERNGPERTGTLP